MTEQLLDGADVVTVLEQVGRERVPERVTARMLRDPGTEHGLPDGALEDGFVQVVPAPPPAKIRDARFGDARERLGPSEATLEHATDGDHSAHSYPGRDSCGPLTPEFPRLL